jgi:aspartate/methionine/tyrosine aminotransferase
MPPFRPFALERYFGRHEHRVAHLLGSSDCEPLRTRELLALAGAGAGAAELLDLRLGYTETRGAPPLRQALAAWYPGLGADDVLVAGAPQEAILLLLQSCLRPGDRVVIQTPCYQSLSDVARELGCEVVPWPVRLEARTDGPCAALDFDALPALLTGDTRLLVTNAPHNPTGAMPTRAQWDALAALVRERCVRWFSDEMYRGLARSDEGELPPAASLVDGAVSLWGLSKSLNLPGLRLGWLASRDRALLAAIEQQKDWTSICSNALSEVLAVHALRAAPALFAQNRARIAANAAAMVAFAARHGDLLAFAPPAAGPVALAHVRRGTATELADAARERAGVMLVPSMLFGLDDRWLRVGLGRNPAAFAAGLQAWERALA